MTLENITEIPDSFLIVHLVPVVMSLVHLIIIVTIMPESIRFLTLQKKMTEVERILAECRSDRNDIEHDLAIWTEHRPHFLFVLEADLANILPGFGLYAFKQLTAAIPLLFYFRQIFELIGE